jgi:hypothetical protein
MIQRPALLFWLTLLLCSGCYSFKGISIDPDVNTFFVQNFETSASNAPPTLALDFTERLKDKIRSESRLVLKSDNPDVEFTGRIASFVVVPVAPKPGEVVSLNQLKISVAIKYINNKNEKKSWPNERTKSHFAEFSNTADLLTVQDELIRQISIQLLDDIFNEAFNDW